MKTNLKKKKNLDMFLRNIESWRQWLWEFWLMLMICTTLFFDFEEDWEKTVLASPLDCAFFVGK
jgi:hypothetical protein